MCRFHIDRKMAVEQLFGRFPDTARSVMDALFTRMSNRAMPVRLMTPPSRAGEGALDLVGRAELGIYGKG